MAKNEKYRAEKNDKHRASRSFDKTKKTPMAWTFAKNGEQQHSEKTAVSLNAMIPKLVVKRDIYQIMTYSLQN